MLKQFALIRQEEPMIKRVRKAYSGRRIAIMSLPVEKTLKLLAAGSVRISWDMCRSRERVALKQCFRCVGFGHIAKVFNTSNDYFRNRVFSGKEDLPEENSVATIERRYTNNCGSAQKLPFGGS